MNKELLKELLVYAIFAVILFLFYRSLWAFLVLPPAIYFYHRYNRKQIVLRKKEILGKQFKDALISLSSALRAGYSIENGLGQALSEMKSVYGGDSPICTELGNTINEIGLGIETSKAIGNMAARSDVEDIRTFAEVFQIARTSGGDLIGIIKKTADDISSKIETQEEIGVLVSSKKLEQKIMSLMPMGIIVYISLASPTLIEPMYGNALGVVLMSVSLGIYIAAYLISLKIMNIKV